jgi:endonuclease/exonuclease/phosphatase family metal-dependent hydrolase
MNCNAVHILFLVLLSAKCLCQQTSESSFAVMTYNIRYDEPRDGTNNWHSRKKEVTDLILSLNAGNDHQSKDMYGEGLLVFGIQEGLHHQVTYIDSMLPSYAYIGCGRDDGREKGEYSAIFYNIEKLALQSSGTFWLSETPDIPSRGWDAALPRICTYGLFEVKQTGKKIFVFNTHFDHIGQKAREESVSLIRYMADKINFRRYPCIIMGDFNAEPGAFFSDFSAHEWQDSWLVASKKTGPEGTFHGFGKEETRRRIDYIFVRSLRVLSAAHLPDLRLDAGFLSDHLPVMTTLTF